MRASYASISLISLSYLSTFTSAVPFTFANNPLGNGYPNPNAQQLLSIETEARGSLPNGPSPSSVSPDTVTSLQLIAFNEIFETAFFTNLIANITNDVEGYKVPDVKEKVYILESLKAVQAQEELHTLFANTSLSALGAQPVEPCAYKFPVTNLADAITLASTFTDVVLSVLPDVQSRFAKAGDSALIPGVGSVIGQEGEQNGAYRVFGKKVPSALPFLTAGTREFAFSALNQMFVVPGSCKVDYINLTIYEPLTVVTQKIEPKEQNLSFTFELPANGAEPNWADLSIAYVNQQNLPIVEQLQNVVVCNNKTVEFQARFPYNATSFGNGLTFATITKGATKFTSAEDVAKATVYGPGLIEIN